MDIQNAIIKDLFYGLDIKQVAIPNKVLGIVFKDITNDYTRDVVI